jgi:hypothetical protein
VGRKVLIPIIVNSGSDEAAWGDVLDDFNLGRNDGIVPVS